MNVYKVIKVPRLLMLSIMLCLQLGAWAQSAYKVNGSVRSVASGVPVEGAVVSMQGIRGAQSVVSDENGEFVIEVPGPNVTLELRADDFHQISMYLGDQRKVTIMMYSVDMPNPNRTIESFGHNTNLAVMPDGYLYDDQVSNKTQVNKFSFDQTLQGAASGVMVSSNSGSPWAANQILFRGPSSFSGNGQPLLVVDGILIRSDKYPHTLIKGTELNPLGDFSPHDIKSMTVLKDAAAQAQYGAQGANGVIVITTHKGEVGSTRVDFTAKAGVANAAGNELPLLSSDQHKVLLQEGLYNAGWTSQEIFDQYGDFINYHKIGGDSDWMKSIENKNAFVQDYHVRVSGGDQKARYALSMGYRGDEGMIDNTDASRFTGRLNVDYQLSKKVTFQGYVAISNVTSNQMQQEAGYFNPMMAAFMAPPSMNTMVQNEAGGNTSEYTGFGNLNLSNPFALIKNQEMTWSRNRFNMFLGANYDINSSWSARANFSYDLEQDRSKFFIPEAGISPQDGVFRPSGKSTGSYVALAANAELDWKKVFDLHKVFVRAKVGMQTTRLVENLGMDAFSGTDYQNNMQGSLITTLTYANHNVQNLDAGIYANYQYADRYFANAVLRFDASSRYGVDVPVVASPALTAGWNFWRNPEARRLNINLARLTLNYGTSYSSQNMPWYINSAMYTPSNYLNFGGVVNSQLSNFGLRPEMTQEFSVGLELHTLQNRLQFVVEPYVKNTSDIIVPKATPGVSGVSMVKVNGAKVRNSGVELSAQYYVVDKSDLKWKVGANMTYNHNEVSTLPEGRDIVFEYHGIQSILREGESMGAFYGYATHDNVIASQREVPDNLINEGYAPFAAGDVRFVDQNNDGVINKADKVVLGSAYAKLYGGISTGLEYKRWNLDILADYKYGNHMWNATKQITSGMKGLANASTAVQNRWRKDGDITNMPRAVYGDPVGNTRNSDRFVEDASFFRIRNIQLGYTIPNALFGIKAYVTADNMFTFTKYTGLYPEANAAKSIVAPGIDYGTLPQTKSLMVGVKLSL